MASSNEQQHNAVIGNGKDFWLYNSESGFDLTHPPTPESPPVVPRVTIETKTSQITVDPAKTALVVIDMQNFFLSAALGRERGKGHDALDQLVEHAVPACREAKIRILWVNWGLTQQEINAMPPAIVRAFGFDTTVDGKSVPVNKHGDPTYEGGDKQFEDGKDGRKHWGLGKSMGTVKDAGKDIDAGKMLMRDQWNTGLCPPLNKLYEEGKKLDMRPDVWIHKNRMSAMWSTGTLCEEYLQKEGIKTLLFTGVNTDQCVGGTYQDCFSKGYDCVLLSDGCGTTSPEFAQQSIEFNSANVWGFMTTCKALADGVANMEK